MDKLSEMLVGSLAILGGFLTKRIFKNTDTLSDRITALEKVMLVKEDLNSLERDVAMIDHKPNHRLGFIGNRRNPFGLARGLLFLKIKFKILAYPLKNSSNYQYLNALKTTQNSLTIPSILLRSG